MHKTSCYANLPTNALNKSEIAKEFELVSYTDVVPCAVTSERIRGILFILMILLISCYFLTTSSL
jgi:uncharacterized membrane protein